MAQSPEWEVRVASHAALSGDLVRHAELLDAIFATLDSVIRALEQLDTRYGALTAVLAVKGKHLTFAYYSLSLDGLAQEAGALFRPTLEVIELLQYLALEPSRADAIASTRDLPRAGVVSQRVDGKFKELRAHLNENASHLSLSAAATRHLIDAKSESIRLRPQYHREILISSLGVVARTLLSLCAATTACLHSVGDQKYLDFRRETDRLNEETRALFKISSEAADAVQQALPPDAPKRSVILKP